MLYGKNHESCSFFSLLHSLKDDGMLCPSQCAQNIERATKASLILVLQLVALSSGIFEDEDYIIDFTTLSGNQVRFIKQRKRHYPDHFNA